MTDAEDALWLSHRKLVHDQDGFTQTDEGLVEHPCRCGHDRGAHLMIPPYGAGGWGKCRRHHYGDRGQYVGGGCECQRYEKT